MRRLALSLLLLATFLAPTTAEASQLIARDAQNVTLQVDSQGQALVGYRAKAKTWSVLAWGAVNALHPTADRSQVRFKLDYAGGWGKYRKTLSRGFTNVCRPYAGPPLSVVRHRLHDARREPLGPPGLAAGAPQSRPRPVEASPGRATSSV